MLENHIELRILLEFSKSLSSVCRKLRNNVFLGVAMKLGSFAIIQNTRWEKTEMLNVFPHSSFHENFPLDWIGNLCKSVSLRGVRRKIFSQPHSSVIQSGFGVNEASNFEVLSDNGMLGGGLKYSSCTSKAFYLSWNWLFVESLFYSHNRFIILCKNRFSRASINRDINNIIRLRKQKNVKRAFGFY